MVLGWRETVRPMTERVAGVGRVELQIRLVAEGTLRRYNFGRAGGGAGAIMWVGGT